MSKSSLPYVPPGFNDLDDAIHSAKMCESAGFVGEVVDMVCRECGCDVQYLKDIAKWADEQKEQEEQKLRALEEENAALKAESIRLAEELRSVKELKEMRRKELEAHRKECLKLSKEHKKLENKLELQEQVFKILSDYMPKDK